MTANPLKGQVEFTVGEDSYVLAYPINTCIVAETPEWFGRPFDDVKADLLTGKLGLADARKFFRLGLDARQPELSEIAAGEIMGQLGNVEAGALMGRALFLTFGPPAEGGAADGPPGEGEAGTGPSVSASGTT